MKIFEFLFGMKGQGQEDSGSYSQRYQEYFNPLLKLLRHQHTEQSVDNKKENVIDAEFKIVEVKLSENK